MSKRSDVRDSHLSQPAPSSRHRLSKRPPVSTSEYPDSKRISLAKDPEKPARGRPVAGKAHYAPSKSPQEHHIVLPPPPGPPPAPTVNITNDESPTKGPVTPLSGQVHQRPFAATTQHHTPGSPAPPSPPHVYDAMARGEQFVHPSSPPHRPSPAGMAAASYTHPPPSPPPHPAAPYPHPPHSLLHHPAAYTARYPDTSAAYVPGSFVAGVPFDSLPPHHQNFILKTATHCWRDQYADLQQDNDRLKTATHCWKDQYANLQQDNERLRASIASDKQQREVLEDRLQLLEMRFHRQEGGHSTTASVLN